MIPSGGWVPATFDGFEEYPLPEPYSIVYRDSYRFGRVSDLRLLVDGAPSTVNRSGFRLIDIELILNHVYDIVLLDRIE